MEKSKWYLSTWFIAVLLAFFVAPVAGSANSTNIVTKVSYVADDYNFLDNYNTTAAAVTAAKGGNVAITSIYIGEDDVDFTTGDTFRLSLPSGVKWSKDIYNLKGDKSSTESVYILATGALIDLAADPPERAFRVVSITDRDLELEIVDNRIALTREFGNGSADSEHKIVVPLYFEVDGAVGEVKVTVDARGSTLTSGQYTIAVIGESETSALVDKVQTVYNDNSFTFEDASTLRIDETAIYTLSSGDTFRIELPLGVKWNSEVVDLVRNGKGTIVDNQTLEIAIQEETYKLKTIFIPLVVNIDGFRGELQAHIVPLDSKVTEEKITFAQVVPTKSIEKTVSFPKTKINIKSIWYEDSFESFRADEGFTFAKVNMDIWIEEEPKDKVNWSAVDFLNKWVLNDGREISDGYFTAGSSNSVEVGKWKNVTVALQIRDYQKIASVFVIDPLENQNTVKVPIEGPSGSDQIELKSLMISDSIQLTWNSRSEAEYYLLYRREVEQGEFYPIATITTPDTIYIDTNVEPNIMYWYKISAVKDDIEIQHSNIVKAILPRNNSGGSTGGGGGSSSPSSVSKEISALNGGTVEKSGAKVEIPANAHTSSFKVTIKKLTNPSTIVKSDNSRIISDIYEITKDKTGEFDKSLTISLPFDKSKYDAENYGIGIFWYNEVLEKWIELDNVKVDLSSGMVSGEVNHFTKFAILATVKEEQSPGTPESVQAKDNTNLETSVQFSDIKGHWAEKGISYLANKGYISGYQDHTFRPNQTITRAEFASILVKVLNLKEDATGKIFNDTKNHWARGAIATAHSHGIINGYNESTFGANDPITREQMATMIVKAFKLKHNEPLKTFKDESKTSKWAIEAVKTAIAEGIIGGYDDGTYKSQGNATRGEAATLIVRVLNR